MDRDTRILVATENDCGSSRPALRRLEPRGSRRLSSPSILDLRVSRTIRIGGWGRIELLAIRREPVPSPAAAGARVRFAGPGLRGASRCRVGASLYAITCIAPVSRCVAWDARAR